MIFRRIEQKLDAILELLGIIIALLTKENKTMGKLDDVITDLTAKVTQQTTVTASVVSLVSGLAAQLAAALEAAKNAGATPEQLASFTALANTIAANDDTLAAAVAANTVAA